MPQPRVMLVVTGDDFGYCPRRNQGIVDCFQAGGISNVSLLVNACAAKEAADLAKRHSIPIGLHANLSEGLPVCQPASTLTNQHGFLRGKMGFRQALERGQLSMKQVELELRAQVRLFRDLTGHVPHHMDGHQHVHVLPGVREVFAQVLSELNIPFTRVPVEPGLHSCPALPAHLRRFYAQVEKDALDSIPVFTRYGIRSVQVARRVPGADHHGPEHVRVQPAEGPGPRPGHGALLGHSLWRGLGLSPARGHSGAHGPPGVPQPTPGGGLRGGARRLLPVRRQTARAERAQRPRPAGAVPPGEGAALCLQGHLSAVKPKERVT